MTTIETPPLSISLTTTNNNNNNNHHHLHSTSSNTNTNNNPTTTNNTQITMRRRKGGIDSTSSSALVSPNPDGGDDDNNNNNNNNNSISHNNNNNSQQQQQHEQQEHDVVPILSARNQTSPVGVVVATSSPMFPSVTFQTLCIVGITILVISIQIYFGVVQQQRYDTNHHQYNNNDNNNNNNYYYRQLVSHSNNNVNEKDIVSHNGDMKSTSSSKQQQQPRNQCRIYLAPSSVKGLQGYGIFTTDDMAAGEIILSQPDGPSIPVVDYLFEPAWTGEYGATSRKAWIRVWDNYWWGRGVSDIVLSESETGQVIDYQIMFGSLPNHHCILSVLDHTWSIDNNNNTTGSSSLNTSPYYDDTMDLPNSSPGTGAYSYYAGRNFFVKRSMQAGDEIFLNYGHCHDEIERMPSWAATIPKRYDFQITSRIVRRLHRYIQQQLKYNNTTNRIPNVEWYKALHDKAIKSVRVRITDQILQLLPDSYETYELIISHIPTDVWLPSDNNDVTTRNNEMISRVIAKYIGTNIRDVDSIRQNGICLENIIPQRSTIPYAGRGAFAQFPIKVGEVVVPVPMLQIPNKDSMNLYEDGSIYTKQLLLNYCFGHNESSLLVCPNTNAILINHCSVRTKECGPKGPNAKYRWATTWDKDTSKWLQMSVDEIMEQEGRGISMEIVATRDIQPGDEIFIDYGEGWEKDWEQHKAGWFDKPNSKIDRPSVLELNKREGPLTELVSGNLRKYTNDEYLQTHCVFWTDNDDYYKIFTQPSPDWMTWDDETILETFACDGEAYVQDFTTHGEQTYWPCSVLLPEDPYGEYYTVRIHPSRFAPDLPWVKNKVPRIITGYPRASIRYFYRSYKTDMHLDGVFRRHIDIDDSIFPEAWKNRKIVDDISTSL